MIIDCPKCDKKFELDQNLNRGSSWVLGSSYSYAARNYKHTEFGSDHILISTRNGIEIFNLKEQM